MPQTPSIDCSVYVSGSLSKWAHLVPKGLDTNLSWRKQVYLDAAAEPEYAADLRQMCREDLLFYVNAFVWIGEPRAKTFNILPFITYPYQDPALLELEECMGSEHLCWEKSRCLGATWMGMTAFQRRWLLFPDQKFLVASSKESMVDTRNDAKSLFGKIDFINRRLPPFLRPTLDPLRDRTHMRIYNPRTESLIAGAATTEDIARGDRVLALWLDEYGAYKVDQSWRVAGAIVTVAGSVFFNSTHQGTAGAFYAKSQSKIRKRRMHWTEHPLQSRGMYTFVAGELQIIDDTYDFPPDFDFIPTDPHGEPLDGSKFRSPYYDAMCEELMLPVLIAQEMDINPEGSAEQWFSQGLISSCKKRSRSPDAIGELDYDVDTAEPAEGEPFAAQDKGKLWLWCNVVDGAPPESDYVLAADVAAGSGASNSAVVVYDKRTNTKVAELATPYMAPEPFGVYVEALRQWFHNGFLIWDASGGLGGLFGKTIMDLGARKVFYRQQETTLTKKKTDKPGFIFSPGLKAVVFGRYRNALARQTIHNVSERALDECRHFVYAGDTVEHSGSLRTIDATGARANHGDIATADVLANHALTERPYVAPDPEKEAPPIGSMAERMAEARVEDAFNAVEEWYL
ncbi:MAG TPA: hypothetical protein VM238_01360 [Phycisphaerae bacterium]|nr:hypothetical protein [Phycisphaerae bacterium]